jgi:hypothetical protein
MSYSGPGLNDRLEIVVDWYKGMVDGETKRLVYEYRPEDEVAIADGSPIRDIAAIWDMAILSGFLGRSELRPVIGRSLEHYGSFLIPHGASLILDSRCIGEPSGIAHSAFLALAFLDSGIAGRKAEAEAETQATAKALVDGILRQQREDGSYRIYFGGERDEGLDFYPAEAMLAIMAAYEATHDRRYLESVERGFDFHEVNRPPRSIGPERLVFYANWQAQYTALLHRHATTSKRRQAIRDYVLALHDRIVDEGFYDELERDPARQATVEVACALEGVADAYEIAAREQDARRKNAYEACIRIALAFLFRAQRLEDCTPRERGGFGHTLSERTQRIDVTGHVAAGFIKCARHRIGLDG